MKRVLLLGSALLLAVACGSFSGSDSSGGGGGGGGGDDGGGADGGDVLGDGDGSVKGGNHDGSSQADGGAVALEAGGDGGVDPLSCTNKSVVCQDFGTAQSLNDGYVGGVLQLGVFTPVSSANGGTLSLGGMVMDARTYGTKSQTALIQSPATLSAASFTLTMAFGMNIPVGTTADILVLSLGNGTVTFTATPDAIDVASTLAGGPAMLPAKPALDTVLTVVYTSNTFTIALADGSHTTMPYNNGVLAQVRVGARSADNIDNFVKGYNVTSP